MKLKKIKNYILTFVICLLGAFAFNSIETNAMVYNNDTNNYVSSNILNSDTLVIGNVGSNGDFESSNFRLRSPLISLDNEDPMSRVVYVKIFSLGLCNDFVGARFAIHGYTSNSTSSHSFDSGWKSISNGAYNYVDLPSNVTHIALVFSFSSTSSNVTSNGTEITSLSLNQVRCIQFFTGHYSISSGEPFEPYGYVYSYGSIFKTCMARNATNNLYNCLPYLDYGLIGPSFDFSEVRTQMSYNNINPTGYFYYLTTYNDFYIGDLGLYFKSSSNSLNGFSVEFFLNGSSIGGFNLSSASYIDLSSLSSDYFDAIEIYNPSLNNSIVSFDFINYDLINDAYFDGYDIGYDNGSSGQNTLVGMVGAIFTGPVTMFQQIFNFNVLGINFAEMLLGLVTLLVVIWLVKKFI